MLIPQLSTTVWLQVPTHIRRKIVDIFQIPRSEGAHVIIGGHEIGRPTSDGHSPKDLAVITVEKLQEYTKLNTNDFFALFDALVQGLSSEEKLSSEEVAKKLNDDRVSKWSNILVAMRLEAKELGLEDELANLFALTTTPKRGRPARG